MSTENAKQQGLSKLREQGATPGAGQELVLDDGDDRFDQRPPIVLATREGTPHFGRDSVDPPRSFSASTRNHTLGPELPTDVGMVAFAVELGLRTTPMRATRLAVLTRVGRFAPSFHGPVRADCARTSC